MRTVQILGTAPNLHKTLPLLDKERWGCNSPLVYTRRWRPNPEPNPLYSYTRWFNMHSRRHMLATYPDWYNWYGEQTKPIVLQEVQPDIPASERFPREAVLAYAGHRYITHSAAWFLAAVGAKAFGEFERVELGGFQLNVENTVKYNAERPCFFYWVDRLRREGIEVVLPEDLIITPAGDPEGYDGPLYGYETT